MILLPLIAFLAVAPQRTTPRDPMTVKVWATAKIGLDTWKIKSYWDEFGEGSSYAFVYRNRRVVTTRFSQDCLSGRFLRWPFKGRLLALIEHSSCGHGMRTRLYVIDSHRLIGPLLKIEGEVGGPIFRDYDRDGRPEMVFDNYDYYEMGERPPTRLRVHKVSKDYQITLWKEVQNKGRKHLPFRLKFF